MFCLLIWRCLQVKSSILREDGQKKRSKRKSRSLFILPFTKKIDNHNRYLGEAFEHNFLAGVGGGRRRFRNLNEPIFKNSNSEG